MSNEYTRIPGGSQEYYTRFMSLSTPPGNAVFELLIVTEDKPSVITKVTDQITRHNIDILSISGARDVDIGRFVQTLFCDFAKADCATKDLVAEIRKFPFVTEVECSNMKGRQFDAYRFPIRILNKHRAILMGGDPLLAVERRLQQMLGSPGSAIMFEQGRTYARANMATLRHALPNTDPEELSQNAVDWLRASGWGLCTFQREQNTCRVLVEHPPTSEESYQSMFFRGVATATAESMYESRFAVRGADYDEKTDTLTLTLEKAKQQSQANDAQ